MRALLGTLERMPAAVEATKRSVSGGALAASDRSPSPTSSPAVAAPLPKLASVSAKHVSLTPTPAHPTATATAAADAANVDAAGADAECGGDRFSQDDGASGQDTGDPERTGARTDGEDDDEEEDDDDTYTPKSPSRLSRKPRRSQSVNDPKP